MAEQQRQLILYSYFRSSCSARVRIALNLKGLAYQTKYVNLLKAEHSSAEYDAINPSHFVPTLQLLPDNTLITQSVAILEFLDEAYPHVHPLLPPATDVVGRAAVRALVAVIACDTQPVTNMRILTLVDRLGGSKSEWAAKLMSEGLNAYERLVEKTAGTYSYGDTLTMADVCLVPAVWGALRFGVDIDKFPTIKRIYEQMSGLDAVIKGHWKNQGDTPEELKA